jgi:hypothetical protein
MTDEDEKQSWEGVEILLQVGDVITSKKGFLTKTAILNKHRVNKRLKYLGNGLWESLDEGTYLQNVKETLNNG